MKDDGFDKAEADRLVADLSADPGNFSKGARANQLLGQFVGGYPLENLRPLLHDQNPMIATQGFWIASELGVGASVFLDDAIAALGGSTADIRFSALDVVMVCGTREREGDFVHVIAHLDDSDASVRTKALWLLCRAADSQLMAATGRLELDEPSSVHLRFLRQLLRARASDPAEVDSLIRSPDRIGRRYGIAIANRLYNLHPQLLTRAAGGHDEELRSASQHLLRLREIDGGRGS